MHAVDLDSALAREPGTPTDHDCATVVEPGHVGGVVQAVDDLV
jgi:hypothetical protein